MITAEQLRAARALLRWDQKTVAGEAKISLATLRRLEGGEGPLKALAETAHRLEQLYLKAGIEFIEENSGGSGVRFKKPTS